MSNIHETLFRTIETIADSKISQLKFDKTIEAIITSDKDADKGEYELKYQDLLFKAYPLNNTTKFKKDENVLVLIPEGDMSKRKTITSSSKKEGEDYVDLEQDVIDRLGVNFVDEDKDFKIKLSTFTNQTIGFKLKKQKMINEYPGQKFLAIGADIYTNINKEDLSGTYGIAVDCIFVDDKGERKPHTFELKALNVTGNPFQARGYKETLIPLAEEGLVEVVSARAYSDSFTRGNEDIVLKQLTVEYVGIKDKDRSEYSGNIIAPKGTHFKSSNLYPDEKLQLTMEFKQQSEIINTEAISYKWFVMNGEISSTDSPHYHPDAGFGWQWIKSGDFEETLITGAGTRTLEISADFVPNFSTFMCVATYKDKDVKVSETVTLVDHSESIDIEIVSDNGISFVNGNGQAHLTCNVSQNSKPLGVELDYEWTQVKDSGSPILIQKGPGNKILVLAKNLGLKSTYLCEVSKKGESRPIATSYITLVNVLDGSTQGIVVVGGFRTGLYDADGNAPTQLAREGFQFDIYDNGEKVDLNSGGVDWTWAVPSVDKTLLVMKDANNNPTLSSKDRIVSLSLQPKFDLNKTQNILSIEARYTKNGITNTLRADTNISLTRVGTTGATGATGKPGIDGKVYVTEIQGGSPTVVYNGNGEIPMPSTLNEFVLMFSEDGNDAMASKIATVEWTLPPATECILNFSGTTARTIRTIKPIGDTSLTNPHKVILTASGNWNGSQVNNYLSAKFQYASITLRETYPVSVAKNGEQPYTLTLISSNGLLFKDGVINTDIKAELRKGTTLVDPMTIQSAFKWKKTNALGQDVAFVPNYVNSQKHIIRLSSSDVDEKATFRCEIDL